MKHSLLTRDEKRAITFLLPGVLVTALLIIYPLVYIDVYKRQHEDTKA